MWCSALTPCYEYYVAAIEGASQWIADKVQTFDKYEWFINQNTYTRDPGLEIQEFPLICTSWKPNIRKASIQTSKAPCDI